MNRIKIDFSLKYYLIQFIEKKLSFVVNLLNLIDKKEIRLSDKTMKNV